ncbi:MAG TPA: flavodoxin family protein [Spirochaetota bacterium]|mgnify:CR=1 FL=1|nr:flavodoxin family protein [Spirochaetota bacterium]HPS85537.1 flavodoxin family protein [Spirochaetota bacterium]
MKTISFLGSPRRNGNTAALLNRVLDGIYHGNSEVREDYIFLHEKNIKPCSGCNSCKLEKNGKCIIKDDMQEIYSGIGKSDLIIMASPIYWWSVTAQMKLLIDRLYGINKDCGRKKVMLLMTYEGELPNSGPETVEKIFREICGYLHLDVAGVMGVCTGTVAVADNAAALEQAFELGKSL